MKKISIYRALLPVFAWALMLCYAQTLIDNSTTRQSTATKVHMDNSGLPLRTGMVYSKRLALLSGVPKEQRLELMPPSLGAALEIKEGNRGGNICRLHIYYDSDLAIRLPSLKQLASASAKLEQFPFASIKKPTSEIRQAIGEDVRQLANRAIVRFGSSPLISCITSSHDFNTA
jgi:hypothetical protein